MTERSRPPGGAGNTTHEPPRKPFAETEGRGKSGVVMKITYAGESFLTTDAVADGLLDFVAALGERHEAESVAIPAITKDGTSVFVRLVVGPASELISVPVDSTLAEPDTSDFVSELLKRTRALSSPRPVVDPEWGPAQAYGWDELV